MSTLFEELERQARTLAPRERARLARVLIDDLDPAVDAEVEQLWIDEARHRYEAFRKGELKTLPGDEVMQRARDRLK